MMKKLVAILFVGLFLVSGTAQVQAGPPDPPIGEPHSIVNQAL